MKWKTTDQLRRCIDESGYSRYAICKETGIHQSVLSKFMHGEGWLSVESFDALGDFLGLNISLRSGKRGPKKGK